MRARCFIDLDRTLYRTHEVVDRVRQDLLASGSTAADIDRHTNELSLTGYSFKKHLTKLGYTDAVIAAKVAQYHDILANGDSLLFPNVADTLRTLSARADLYLLTYGDRDHQRAKFDGIGAVRQVFTARYFVWTEETKGDVIRRHGAHPATWFLDDSAPQLEDVQAKAPWAHAVRIRWPGAGTEAHPKDDQAWPVVTELAAFATLVA